MHTLISVDSFTRTGNTFHCACDDGEDRDVMASELFDSLAQKGAETIDTFMGHGTDARGEYYEMHEGLTLPEWLHHTDPELIRDAFAHIINLKERRYRDTRYKPIRPDDFLPNQIQEALKLITPKTAA